MVTLLVTTSYSILVNETSWENSKRAQITYLNRYPSRFLPFSRGLWANIGSVFCHKGKIREYALPPLDDPRSHKDNNPCRLLAWLCECK